MTLIERPVVNTESGSVRGTAEGGVAAFRGIPYAASPVGDRRFAAPVRHPAWPDVRDADRPGPSVPQSPPGSKRSWDHAPPTGTRTAASPSTCGPPSTG